MPRTRSIQDSQLTEGAIAMVRGHIAYSRLLTHIDGDELVQSDRRKIQNGMQPVGKPYTTVTLIDPKIVPTVDTKQHPTPEEKFLEESFYVSSKDNETYYSTNNKSPYPNNFYQGDAANPMNGTGFIPEAELANGLDVLLIMRVVRSKSFGRKYLALSGIVIEEPVRYYQGMNTAAMAEAGLTLTPAPASAAQASAPAAAPSEPAHEPVSAPETGNAFQTDPQPAPAMNPPESPWICPKCHATVPAGQKFCGSCGTPQPAAAGNPYANAATIGNQSGIRYDADNADRNY